MTERCHDLEEMGFLADLPAGDPQLAHLQNCPHCRALLAAYRGFERGYPAAGDPEREQALGHYLAREIGPVPVVGGGARPRGFFRFMRSPVLAPGLAAAAVLVLFLSFQQYRFQRISEPSMVNRGRIADDLQLVAGPEADGGVRLQWQAPAGAQTYVVVVYATDLQELARLEAGREPALSLSPDRLAVLRPTPQPLIWRVEAYRDGDLLLTSLPGVIPLEQRP